LIVVQLGERPMTEQEWLECADSEPMLVFLRGKSTDRKLRLFYCACCRRIEFLLPDVACHQGLGLAERFADGLACAEELIAGQESVQSVWNNHTDSNASLIHSTTLALMTVASHPWEWAVSERADLAASFALQENEPEAAAALRALFDAQPKLVRDIFGNPFRPVTVDSAWLSPTVVSLATRIYDDRAFDRLPILADALEDAGCTNADILNHCRQPGEHVRGCWAVDLVLGKE
jgi:hypothetical protein